MHLQLARWWLRALKVVTLLVLPLLLVSCTYLVHYRAARAYLGHRYAAMQALNEDDCSTAEQEMRKAIEAAKGNKELFPNEVSADVMLSEAYKLLGYVYVVDQCARPAEAVGPYTQALSIVEEALGSDHPFVAGTLNDLGRAYYLLGRYEQAEPVLVRALEIYQASNDASRRAAMPPLNLAELYQAEGRYTDAEAMFERSLDAIQRAHLSGKASGKHVAGHLTSYAGLLRQIGRLDEAEKLELRAREIESEDQ